MKNLYWEDAKNLMDGYEEKEGQITATVVNQEGESVFWDVEGWNISDTEGSNDADDSDVESWLRIYQDKLDENWASIVQDVCNEYNLKFDLLMIDTDYYFFIEDESKFIESLKNKMSKSDIDLVELYDNLNDDDLKYDVEEMIIRPKLQGDRSYYYEGYYHQGDASDKEVIEHAKEKSIDADELFDTLDNEHEAMKKDAIIENYETETYARQRLLELTVKKEY